MISGGDRCESKRETCEHTAEHVKVVTVLEPSSGIVGTVRLRSEVARKMFRGRVHRMIRLHAAQGPTFPKVPHAQMLGFCCVAIVKVPNPLMWSFLL